jgi:DNA-binding response OmpR family regulator
MLNTIYQSDQQRTVLEQQKSRCDRRTKHPVVVIVEHDPAVLELMKEVLQAEGYTIHGFIDHYGQAAVIQQICPDLVILEAHPRFTNTPVAMIRQLRGNERLRATPIIIDSTDRRLLESIMMSLDNQRCYTFEKPFDSDCFLQCVQSVIGIARKDSRANASVYKGQE